MRDSKVNPFENSAFRSIFLLRQETRHNNLSISRAKIGFLKNLVFDYSFTAMSNPLGLREYLVNSEAIYKVKREKGQN